MSKKTQKKKSVAEYDLFLDRKLGGGAFGSVYQGFNNNTKERVAVKMIPKSNMYNDNDLYMMNAFKRQSLILSKISSENVVGFKDIIATKRYFYIFQELCDGDLRDFLTTHKAQPEKKAIEMMIQLLNGFYALIVTNVIHRDIKPQNILFKNNQLKLADFGLSRRVGGDQLLTSYVGTKMYSSPQILTKTKYTSKCDIWSLGLVFYELLYGKKLLSVPEGKLLQKMKQIDEMLQFPIEPEVSQESKEIIRKCLKYNEEDRADWIYLFNHPLFKGGVPSLEKLNMGLNYIISTIRQEIDEKNVDLEKYFKKFGLDKNKEIGFDEYSRIVLRLVTYSKVEPQQIRFSFNYFDRDKSGKISFDEFYSTLQNYGVQMNAATRDQIISNLIKEIKNHEQQQGAETLDDESFTPEELMLYQQTEAAYQKMLKQIKEKKVQDLEQRFQLIDLLDNGLNLTQFTEFIQKNLNLTLTNKQCELIFNKFDDDKNEKIAFDEYYKHICKEVNIPIYKSLLSIEEVKNSSPSNSSI